MKGKFTVEDVVKRKDSAMPTLLKFQNGTLAAVSKENTIYCQVERRPTKTKEAVVVSGGQIYTGSIDASTTTALTDNYICVRSKSTNKVRIIPIEQADLKNTVFAKLDNAREQSKINKEAAAKTLLKQFGGRKASRFMEKREQMNFNVNVVRDELENTVKETSLLDNETLDATLIDIKYMETISPKFNKSATSVSEVYNVENVIPEELLDRLDEEAKVVYATSPDNLPIKSDYLLECIKRIQAKEKQSWRDFRDIKLIVYMDALQTLIGSRVRNFKSLELSGITEKVENDIRTRFTDPKVSKGCTRTTYTTEKALTYFIVLALLISEKHEVDAEMLSRTLKVSKKKIITYAHVVNARPKTRSDLLTLRLPSEMPPLPTGRHFKKKK